VFVRIDRVERSAIPFGSGIVVVAIFKFIVVLYETQTPWQRETCF
jgi:hypothetical protein